MSSNPCAGVGIFFVLFWGTVCAFVSGFMFRAGYDAGHVAGYDAGRRDAVSTFGGIIGAARARRTFQKLPEYRAALNEFPELADAVADAERGNV